MKKALKISRAKKKRNCGCKGTKPARGAATNPAERKRNFLGFGGGRKVLPLEDIRELQRDAADSHCRHHDYKQAMKTAKMSPKRWAKSRGLKVEGAIERTKRRAKIAVGKKLAAVGKKLVENPRAKVARGRSRNGDEQLASAKKLYTKFQGRPPAKVLTMHAPGTKSATYAKLGDLVSLTVLGPDGKTKHKLEHFGGAILAANPGGTQLHIIGGNQDIRALLPALKIDTSKELVEIGPCVEIEYFTRKKFDQFRPVRYYHHLGEDTGDVPVLAFDQRNLQFYLIGGAYKVKPEGIVN